MALGGTIILIYIFMWFNGTPIYDTEVNFFENLGMNIFLIIGIILFYKDFKKTLKIRKENINKKKK